MVSAWGLEDALSSGTIADTDDGGAGTDETDIFAAPATNAGRIVSGARTGDESMSGFAVRDHQERFFVGCGAQADVGCAGWMLRGASG